jgi:hypothetical protein
MSEYEAPTPIPGPVLSDRATPVREASGQRHHVPGGHQGLPGRTDLETVRPSLAPTGPTLGVARRPGPARPGRPGRLGDPDRLHVDGGRVRDRYPRPRLDPACSRAAAPVGLVAVAPGAGRLVGGRTPRARRVAARPPGLAARQGPSGPSIGVRLPDLASGLSGARRDLRPLGRSAERRPPRWVHPGRQDPGARSPQPASPLDRPCQAAGRSSPPPSGEGTGQSRERRAGGDRRGTGRNRPDDRRRSQAPAGRPQGST